MIDKNPLEDVFKTVIQLEGEPIKIGNRILTPTLEYTFYGKQLNLEKKEGNPVLIAFIVKPISFHVVEGQTEWTIQIQNY